jgi:hypothetical protein
VEGTAIPRPGCRREAGYWYASIALGAAGLDDGVARQELRQVRGAGDRPHAGAAAVRDAERLVQVQVHQALVPFNSKRMG